MSADPTIIGHNIVALGGIFQSLSILFGVSMCVGGFFKLKRYGESRTMMSQQMSIFGPLTFLFCGIALLLLPHIIGTFLDAFWQNTNPLSYDGTGWQGIDKYIPDVLMFVRVIGVVAFIRGIHHLSKAGGQSGQPGTIGKALIHIFAGVLCVHVLGVVDLLKSFLDVS